MLVEADGFNNGSLTYASVPIDSPEAEIVDSAERYARGAQTTLH